MNRAAHSFFAAFIGWLVPFVGFLAAMQFSARGFGYITDFKFLLYWPLLFTFLGWLFVGLPIVFGIRGKEALGLMPVMLLATAATTVTYLGVIALYGIGMIFLIWWPVLIGVIGGVVYWGLQRWQPARGWIFWLLPVMFFPFIRYVGLPLGIAWFPYTTHVLAEGAIGNEAFIAVIKRVRVGDSYRDLHDRYPAIFD